ncbi:MAG: DUF2007 domain-containing protein [Candidatus Omnitrophica bacterium]|nr:DUF2007 domain-containing protein [Candidatus Omnitrophota bacterium]
MKLVPVFSSTKLSDVYLVKSMLESANLHVEIFDENISRIAPHHVYGTNGPRLMVPEDQAADAKEIIKEFKENQ